MSYREARVGAFGEVVSSHRNSEGELASVECLQGQMHRGEYVLCFYDEDSPVVAPMLLDSETRHWLAELLLGGISAYEKRT